MVLGVLVGMGIPTLALTPELVSRIAHAVSGGSGEGAIWGEPLFYMVMLWLPAGLAGLAAGTVFGLGHRGWKRRAMKSVA
jgi:hypothetical protein